MATNADEVRSLMEKKDAIEKEIKELNDVLHSQKDVGMHGSLLDDQQFPRNDIDVYTVRHARKQLLCLQNDHKELMHQIEEGLYKVHSAARALKKEEAGQSITTATTSQPMEVGDGDQDTGAFVLVDRVDQGSPAADAGLQVDDLVVQFGSISIHNFKTLLDIGKVVQHSVGRPVGVTVLRGGNELRLALVPKSWSGKGFLGCNIVPIKR